MKQSLKVTLLSVIAIVIGVFGGYLLRGKKSSTTTPIVATTDSGVDIVAVVAEDASAIKKGDVFGSQNETIFKDSAFGYLQAGGLEGEGSHALLRIGGKNQTVYLTSSVTDLNMFVGMEVKVWGETFKGQKAGWLMDVGRVEVLNTKGEVPQD